jgi:hypothetical protein
MDRKIFNVFEFENIYKLDYNNSKNYDYRKHVIQKARDMFYKKLYFKFIDDGVTLCLYPYKKIIDNKEYLIPCSKCFYCRTRKVSEWKSRLENEITPFDGNIRYNHVFFITLTYNNETLNKRINFDEYNDIYVNDNIREDFLSNILRDRFKNDFKRFIQKLRVFFKRNNFGVFKYFAAFEFGNLTDREHYHFILMIKNKLNCEDIEILKKKIQRYWGDKDGQYGFVHIKNVYDLKGISRYVSKYIMKGNIKQEYGIIKKFKLFSFKSRRLGWDGYIYLINNNMFDKVKTIPRALLNRIKNDNPKLYIDLITKIRNRNKSRLFEKVVNTINMDLIINNQKFNSSDIDVAYINYVKNFNEILKEKRRNYFLNLYRNYKI